MLKLWLEFKRLLFFFNERSKLIIIEIVRVDVNYNQLTIRLKNDVLELQVLNPQNNFIKSQSFRFLERQWAIKQLCMGTKEAFMVVTNNS